MLSSWRESGDVLFTCTTLAFIQWYYRKWRKLQSENWNSDCLKVGTFQIQATLTAAWYYCNGVVYNQEIKMVQDQLMGLKSLITHHTAIVVLDNMKYKKWMANNHQSYVAETNLPGSLKQNSVIVQNKWPKFHIQV